MRLSHILLINNSNQRRDVAYFGLDVILTAVIYDNDFMRLTRLRY